MEVPENAEEQKEVPFSTGTAEGILVINGSC